MVSEFGWSHDPCVLVQDENLFLTTTLFQFLAESSEVAPGATPERRKYRERVMHVRFELLAATANTLNGVLAHGASAEVPYQHVPEQFFIKIRADGLFFPVFRDEKTWQEYCEGPYLAFETRVIGPRYAESLILRLVESGESKITHSWHFPFPPLPRVARVREC